MIPDGYINTDDANATPDKILQGYNAYVKGEKIHGTYVPSGSGSTGGVILGENEVVAEKIYGRAGILAGGKLNLSGIALNPTETDRLITYIGSGLINYIIADRKLTENIDGEIVIYNVDTNTRTVYHDDPSLKYSYTYSELGIQGEVKCIAASPAMSNGATQISIGTTVGIYTYLFYHTGNGYIDVDSKITILNPCSDYNAIAYANKNTHTFAYHSGDTIHIVEMLWGSHTFDEVANFSNGMRVGNVMALFRFSPSDRFLTVEAWGYIGVAVTNVILLDNYHYVTNQLYQIDNLSEDWQHGQILFNSHDDFCILYGNPCSVYYNIKDKVISISRYSGNQVIPYDSTLNESAYATFCRNDNYVYAVTFLEGAFTMGCYKTDYSNLSSQWQLVSGLLPIGNNACMPIINIVYNQVFWFDRNNGDFYLYEASNDAKEIIGLEYGGQEYRRVLV